MEQHDDREFAQELLQEMKSLKQIVGSLRDEMNVLKHDMNLLRDDICKSAFQHIHIPMVKQKFSKNDFERNPTVDYLKKCNLDRDGITQLLNMCEKLDFTCGKFLIRHWENGLYNWDEYFDDYDLISRKMLIHFVCKYGREQLVLYVLDIYVKENLDLEYVSDAGWSPFALLCSYGVSQTINYMLDIYVKKNLDLLCVCKDGWSSFLILCRHGPKQSIEHMINVYIEKGYDLGQKTHMVQILCKLCVEIGI